MPPRTHVSRSGRRTRTTSPRITASPSITATLAVALCTCTFALTSVALPAPAHAVVGGTAATPGSYPFMVSMRENAYPYCGGTLVAPQWVLTAAHCATGRTTAELTAVVNQVQIAGSGGEVSGVDRIVIDSSYDSATENYDAALFHLSTPTTGIAAAPLIRPGDPNTDGAGVVATVIGYGSTVAQPISGGGTVSYPGSLQQAQVSIVSDQQCSAVFNGRNEPAVRTDLMLCAGGDGVHDACVGDSGGPLLVPGALPGTWTDVGITSWGAGCAVSGVPGVYTRLADPQIAQFVNNTVAGP